MTSPQLPDAEPQPGRLPESDASPEQLNPYVTMTSLPSVAPVSPTSPNPYVTSTTVLPQPTVVPTASVLSASAVQSAAPTPAAATPQPPTPQPPVAEPLSAAVSEPVPETASSLSIPLPAQPTVSAPAVPSPTVVAPPAPFPTTLQPAPPTMPPPLPPRANRARSRAATPKPAAKQGQAWVVVGVGIVLLIMFLGSLGRESTSDFTDDDPGEVVVVVPDDGAAVDEPPRSFDHLRDSSDGPGSYAEPYAIGEEFTVTSWDDSEWALRVTGVVLDADEIVAASGTFNPEPDPGSQYVLVSMLFTFVGGEEVGHPWYDIMTSISAPDELMYEEHAALDVPGRIYDADYLAVGETVEHALMYSVPTHLIDGSVLLVDAFGDHAYVALN